MLDWREIFLLKLIFSKWPHKFGGMNYVKDLTMLSDPWLAEQKIKEFKIKGRPATECVCELLL